MDGAAFVAYIRDVLMPEIEPGTAVILDNLATHRNKEARGSPRPRVLVPVLATVSPDLNPIELAFSKLKAHLRRIGARSLPASLTPSATSATSTHHRSAGTTFRLQAMSQVNLEML